MLTKTEKIMNYLFTQAKHGRIEIGDSFYGPWIFYVRFLAQTSAHHFTQTTDKTPCLYIPNYRHFLEKMDQYLQLAKSFYKQDQAYFMLYGVEFEKKLALDVLLNATNYDLSYIEQYLDTRIKMLQNPIPEQYYDFGNFLDCKVMAHIEKNPSNLEGPYQMIFHFHDQNHEVFQLPTITFGVVDHTVYLYAVQNKSKIKDTHLAKVLDRYFRKLNKGVITPSIESNVSCNALASLILFLSFMEKQGITNVISPSFMPLRYQANKVSKLNRSQDKATQHQAMEKHNHDQYNITNKLMYLLERYQLHFPHSSIYFDENTDSMHMALDSFVENTDHVAYQLHEIIPVFTMKSTHTLPITNPEYMELQ